MDDLSVPANDHAVAVDLARQLHPDPVSRGNLDDHGRAGRDAGRDACDVGEGDAGRCSTRCWQKSERGRELRDCFELQTPGHRPSLVTDCPREDNRSTGLAGLTVQAVTRRRTLGVDLLVDECTSRVKLYSASRGVRRSPSWRSAPRADARHSSPQGTRVSRPRQRGCGVGIDSSSAAGGAAAGFALGDRSIGLSGRRTAGAHATQARFAPLCIETMRF